MCNFVGEKRKKHTNENKQMQLYTIETQIIMMNLLIMKELLMYY